MGRLSRLEYRSEVIYTYHEPSRQVYNTCLSYTRTLCSLLCVLHALHVEMPPTTSCKLQQHFRKNCSMFRQRTLLRPARICCCIGSIQQPHARFSAASFCRATILMPRSPPVAIIPKTAAQVYVANTCAFMWDAHTSAGSYAGRSPRGHTWRLWLVKASPCPCLLCLCLRICAYTASCLLRLRLQAMHTVDRAHKASAGEQQLQPSQFLTRHTSRCGLRLCGGARIGRGLQCGIGRSAGHGCPVHETVQQPFSFGFFL